MNLAPIYHVIVLILSPLKEGARKFCSSLPDRRGEESVVFVPIPRCSVSVSDPQAVLLYER